MKLPLKSAMLLAAFGVATLLCISSAQVDATAPLKPAPEWSLCEALEKMKMLDGQMIAVRGNLGQTEHGAYLEEPGCQAPTVFDGHAYPRVAYLTSSGSPFVRKPASFSFDCKKYAVTLSWHPEGPVKRITVLGRLDAYPYGEGWLNGKITKIGFGPENGSPMQIVMKDVLSSVDLPASGR